MKQKQKKGNKLFIPRTIGNPNSKRNGGYVPAVKIPFKKG